MMGFFNRLMAICATLLFTATIARGSPSDLAYKDGRDIEGTVSRIDGDIVHLKQGETETTVSFQELSQDSQVDVLKWALPLIFANDELCDLRAQYIQDGLNQHNGHLNFILTNSSPMNLPTSLEVAYNIHSINLQVRPEKTSDSVDRAYKYILINTTNYRGFTDFDGLQTGQSFTWSAPPAINKKPTDLAWKDVDPDFTHYNSDSVRHSFGSTTKHIYELRFRHSGEDVYTYLSEPEAKEKVQGFWVEPSEPQPTPQKSEPSKPSQKTTRPSGILPIPVTTEVDKSPKKPGTLIAQDGTAEAVEIVKVVGDNIEYFNLDTGDAKTTTWDQLSPDSRKAVVSWLIDDLIERDLLVIRIKYEQVNAASNERDISRFVIDINNKSESNLPEGVLIYSSLHRLSYNIKFTGAQFKYQLASMVTRPGVSLRGPILAKAHEILKNQSQINTKPPYDWKKLLGEPFDQEDDDPDNIYVAALELNVAYKETLIHQDISPQRSTGAIMEQKLVREMEKGQKDPQAPRTADQNPNYRHQEPNNRDTTASTTQPTTEDDDDKAPKIQSEAIVIIDVDNGTGTGFLMEMKGKQFLLTNIHVIAGSNQISATTLSGDKIQLPDSFYIAKDRDLAILPINHTGKYLKPIDNLTDSVSIGDKVTVIGNEAGASVATSLTGIVNGIGPSTVELDAKFVEGNSGSPAIHHKSNRVIGLATYYIEYEIPKADQESQQHSNPHSFFPFGPNAGEASNAKKRRRFAERVDNVDQWQAVTFASLRAEQEALDEYDEYLGGILEIAVGVMKEKRVIREDEASDAVSHILEEFHKNYNSSRQSGSSGNQRALAELKDRLNFRLVSIRSNTRKSMETEYYKTEFERLEAFDEELQKYMEGIYTY